MKEKKMNAEYIAFQLDPKARKTKAGFNVKCPLHKDNKASLSIADGDIQPIVLDCKAGCPWESIRDYLMAKGLWPESGRTIYEYTKNGTPLFRMVRGPEKSFACEYPDSSGNWIPGLGGADNKVLFGLPELLKAIEDKEEIFAVEGEKDVLTMRTLGLVATTNPFGAGKWIESFTSSLQGARQLYIIPDEDKPGLDHARQVATSVSKANISVSIVRLPGMVNGQDVTDWVAAGGTKEQLLQLAKAAPKFELVQPTIRSSLYEVSSAGVYFVQPGREKVLISEPVEVIAEARDVNSEYWQKLLKWKDPSSTIHKWPMPMSISADELKVKLGNGGLAVESPQRLLNFLQSCRPGRIFRSTDKVGWFGKAFVLPGQVIGTAEEEVILQSPSTTASNFEQKGTLADWREYVSLKCKGNSRLLFAVSFSFASCLLSLVGEEGGGVHLKGPSSIGKTTLVIVSASSWGGSRYVASWRATDNGLEATAKGHNHCPLILDELSEIDPAIAGKCAYMLANGRGKTRSLRTGEAKAVADWNLLFLSTGEISLTIHMSEDGRRPRAGQEVRLIDLPAYAGADLGVFENIHGAKSPAEFADSLRNACADNHGFAGIEFVSQVSKDYDACVKKVTSLMDKFVTSNVSDTSAGQVHRACKRFALIAAGGELATEFGITGWSTGEATSAAKVCFENWLDERGGDGQIEDTRIVEQVRHYFETHGDSKFAPLNSSAGKTLNRDGFRNTVNGLSEFFVLPQSFKNDVCAGLNPKEVIAVLLKHGILKPQASTGVPQQVRKLPGMGTARCYHISAKIWSAENIKPEDLEPESNPVSPGDPSEDVPYVPDVTRIDNWLD